MIQFVGAYIIINNMKIYISGNFYEEADAKISVFDHGLLYGDGVFEGIRLYKGCLFKLDEHLERLERSAKGILLNIPWAREEIAEIICETCRQNQLVDGYVRLIITRGKGNLGISTDKCLHPELIVIADQLLAFPKEHYENGMAIITVPTQRVGPAVFSAAIKSLNYLNNVLAKMEAKRAGFEEAIMLNAQGFVAEGSADNLFIVDKGGICTPDYHEGALKGITREVVISIARDLGLSVREGRLSRYDIWTANECFLTGTAVEIVPVVEVDGRQIGNGRVGESTLQIKKIFKEKVIKEGRKI